MENSSKKCRECKADIPSDAKVCQFCKAKQGNWFARHKILTIFGVIFLIGIMGAMGGKNSQSSSQNTTPTTSQEGIKNDSKITMKEFEQIKSGMTYQEVITLVGGEGEVLSESEFGNIKTTMYKFEGNGFGANANITVQNGKVSMKAQFGLK